MTDPLYNKLGRRLKLVPPCVYAKPLLDYMNNADVKSALHVTTPNTWDLCSDDINKNYVKSPEGSVGIYTALKGKYKMLKYSGDTDMAVPTYGTRDWIENLNWPVVNTWK